MLSGMSDPEEAQLLRSNVLEEISGKLLALATDAASSTLLEQVRGPRDVLILTLHCRTSQAAWQRERREA